MPTAEQLQQELLKQAIPDIQAVAKKWTAAELELPVVFLVDCRDQYGRGFVEAYIPPEEEYKQKAIRDGGMRADTIATVIKAMPIEWADKILSKMATVPGQSLRQVAAPNQIIVMVVAFGMVKPYHVKAE
jgi:hypothetical protein